MSMLPPFVVLAIVPLLDAPSLFSLIQCSKQQHAVWSSSPMLQALWLWTSALAAASESGHVILDMRDDDDDEEDGDVLPLRNDDLRDDDDDIAPQTKLLQQALEARLLTRGPLCRALRSNNLLVLRQVLRKIGGSSSSCRAVASIHAARACTADVFCSSPPLLLNAAAASIVQRELRAALHTAVFFSSVPCLQHMLQNYFAGNPNVRILGLTPAHCAALLDRPEHLRLLLQSPNVDATMLSLNPQVQGTVLHMALHHSLPCLPICLEAPAAAGLDVNQTDRADGGRTALQHAAMQTQPDALRLLLAAPGIDVNAHGPGFDDLDTRTPLQLAAHFGRPACVAALLGAEGIDINQVDRDGKPALYLAAASPYPSRAGRTRSQGLADYAECVRLLMAAPGVDIHFKIGDAPIANFITATHLTGRTAWSAASESNRAAALLLWRAGVRGPGRSERSLWIAFTLVGVAGVGFVALLAWVTMCPPLGSDTSAWPTFLYYALGLAASVALLMYDIWRAIYRNA